MDFQLSNKHFFLSTDHDIAETVELSVAYTKGDESCVLSKGSFTYTLDTMFLLAQSLAMNCTNSALLQQLELLYTSLFVTSKDQREILDNRLTSAFKQIKLADSWTLFGEYSKYEHNVL